LITIFKVVGPAISAKIYADEQTIQTHSPSLNCSTPAHDRRGGKKRAVDVRFVPIAEVARNKAIPAAQQRRIKFQCQKKEAKVFHRTL
jgi:hypothetical protein